MKRRRNPAQTWVGCFRNWLSVSGMGEKQSELEKETTTSLKQPLKRGYTLVECFFFPIKIPQVYTEAAVISRPGDQ